MSVDAASIMNRDVVTADPEDTVSTIAGLMAKHGISAVPICAKDGTLIGMLSEGDLMPHMGEANEIRRAWWLRLLAEGTDLSQDFLNYIRLDQRRAKQLMHAPVVSATERASVSEVADLMAKHHIKRVPIVRDGKVIGVVSRADLIRLIAQTPDALIDPL